MASLDAASPANPRFGLIGSFPGDARRLEKACSLRAKLEKGAVTASVTTNEVREVLALLPMGGRIEFCAKSLFNENWPESVRQQNADLILQLFRDCFDSIVSSVGSAKADGQVDTALPIAPTNRVEENEWVIISLCTAAPPSAEIRSEEAGISATGGQTESAPAGVLYLKTSDYFVLRALVTVLKSLGPVSVVLFEEYFSRTTSTVFRTQFVRAMIELPLSVFPDKRLDLLYHTSVESVQRLIVSECKALAGLRQGFIERLIRSGDTSSHNDLVHYATSELLEERFLKAVQVAEDPHVGTGKVLSVVDKDWRWNLNWVLHGDVYIRFLSKHLQANAAHPIWCGYFLTEFQDYLRAAGVGTPLSADVALQLFRFYQIYTPLALKPDVPWMVRPHLYQLSQKGEISRQNHALTALANDGLSDGIAYAGLVRIAPPAFVLLAMSSQDKCQQLRNLLVRTPDGFAFDASQTKLAKTLLADLVTMTGSQHFICQLAMEILAALSTREFHRMVYYPNPDSCTLVAETLRSFLDVIFCLKNIRHSKTVLTAWHRLHLAHTPTEFLESMTGTRNTAAHWDNWRISIATPLQRRLSVFASKAASSLQVSSVRAPRSPITGYAGYASILATYLMEVLELCFGKGNQHEELKGCQDLLSLLTPVLNTEAVVPLYPPISGTCTPPSEPGLRTLATVRAVGDRCVSLALSSLQFMLDFDLTSPRYMRTPYNSVLTHLRWISHPLNLSCFPALGPALFAFHKRLLQDCKLSEELQQAGFIMITPKSSTANESAKEVDASKIRWVLANKVEHQRYAETAQEGIAALLSHATSTPSLGPLTTEIWGIVRARLLASFENPIGTTVIDAESLQQIPAFDRFIKAVASLPKDEAEKEKPLILSAVVHHMAANNFDNPASGTGIEGWWDLLMQAVDACGADWPSRDAWLQQFGDISLPPVRERLHQATHDRDPYTRQQAYLRLLRLSSTSLEEFAQSVQFVQRRTKNEAGLYRREIYENIACSVPGMLTRSLEVTNEKDVFSVVVGLTESMKQILSDDMAKRDSVAKGSLGGLGRSLIPMAISHTGLPLLPVRRTWIACGMALDRMVLLAQGNRNAHREDIWALGSARFPSQQAITEEVLHGPLRSAIEDGVRGGKHVFPRVLREVYRFKQHVHVAPEDLYTPDHAVDLLCSALIAQRQEHCDGSPVPAFDDLAEGFFFPSSGSQAMQQLILFCGVRWTEVPFLTSFFERVVASVRTHATHQLIRQHFLHTYSLFNTIFGLYPRGGTAWYELPLIAEACSVMFEHAIRDRVDNIANALRPAWTEMRLHIGKIRTCGKLTLPQLGFFVANVVPLRDRQALIMQDRLDLTKTECLQADKMDTAERSALLLRDLLALAPSAIHLVWSKLLSFRDDIFTSYLEKLQSDFSGVFEQLASTKIDAGVVTFSISSTQALSLNAYAMHTYTRQAMSEAMNQTLPAATRSEAITRFVQSPAASHLDVIALLKKLQDIIAQRERKLKEAQEAKKNKAMEGLTTVAPSQTVPAQPEEIAVFDPHVDILLESVILRIFDTDATWFVLAFLLDPAVIASAPQRTTATILSNLKLWASVDRTVDVLRILLQPGRRSAITFFLHKQILRLLFDCSDNSAQARELFLTEWQQRNREGKEMAQDVRHEVVSLAIAGLDERRERQELAWSIMDDLVSETATREVDTTTLLLLFKPTWQPSWQPTNANDGDWNKRSVAISMLLRETQPPRLPTAGGFQSPLSFGHFHSLLCAEATVILRNGMPEMCQRMAALMRRLSVVSQNRFVRIVAQLQQFLFSSTMEGMPDDESLDDLHRLLMENTINAASSSMLSNTSISAMKIAVLDDTSEWLLTVVPSLYAGLSLQVLLRAFTTPPAGQEGQSCSQLCAKYPYAIRLRDTVGTLLQALLNTTPAQADSRLRVSRALKALMNQIAITKLPTLAGLSEPEELTTWAIELVQAPFRELLDFLRQDSLQYADLLPGAYSST
ncbi:hypothetical protein HKX48_003643 [Thoreauomyces humboldtii]|nr:hypothetical protein HKX48_003643 [Thoreauomyces humboldtii]